MPKKDKCRKTMLIKNPFREIEKCSAKSTSQFYSYVSSTMEGGFFKLKFPTCHHNGSFKNRYVEDDGRCFHQITKQNMQPKFVIFSEKEKRMSGANIQHTEKTVRNFYCLRV